MQGVAVSNSADRPAPTVSRLLFGDIPFCAKVEQFLEVRIRVLLLNSIAFVLFERIANALFFSSTLNSIANLCLAFALLCLLVPMVLTMRTNVLYELCYANSCCKFVWMYIGCSLGINICEVFSFSNINVSLLHLISHCVLSTIRMAINVSVPLLDSLPSASGRTLCRVGALAVAMGEASGFLTRLLDTSTYKEKFTVLQWTKHDNVGIKYTIFSSYDIHMSLSSILIVLAVEIVYKSFRFPQNSVVVVDFEGLNTLHANDEVFSPGAISVVGHFFGEVRGDYFEACFKKTTKLLVLAAFTFTCSLTIIGNQANIYTDLFRILSAVPLIILGSCLALTLRIPILKQLVRVPELYYHVVANFLNILSYSSIFSQQKELHSNAFSVFGFAAFQVGTLLVYISLPFVDAAPPSFRLNLTRALVLLALTQAVFYVMYKVFPAEMVYNHYSVPELSLFGFMRPISLFDIYTKSTFAIFILSASGAFQGLRRRQTAVMLYSAPLLTEVHMRNLPISP